MILKTLEELRQYADDACDAAWGSEDCKQDPINWGDLGCVSAEAYVTEDGEEGFRVLIEEADPHCPNLRAFVAAYLEGCGWNNVDVVTEW
jgi:hypothetical protein